MTTTINASTTAGLVQTADTSGVLALQTAGTTAVSISASQVVSLTSGLAVTGPTTILKNGGTGATAGLLLSGGGASTTFNIDYGTVASNRLYMRQAYSDGAGTIKFQYSSDGTMASPIDILSVIFGTGIAVTGLVDISAATSGQIQFPATQNASANANTLDDYEEGTFTPALSVTTGSISFSAVGGSYVKIGRMVYLRANFQGSATISSPTGDLKLTGLPFTVSSGLQYAGSTAPYNMTAGAYSITVETINGTTTAYIFNFANGTRSSAHSYFQSGMNLNISLYYEV